MKTLLRRAGALALAATLCACAFGNKASYDTVTPEIDGGADGPIAVGVWEQRPLADDFAVVVAAGIRAALGHIGPPSRPRGRI